MKVKEGNHSNKNFIVIILIIICLFGCGPKLLVVPDFPDKCEKQSDFSDVELFISRFEVLDLPDVYNYKTEDFEELEVMFVEYIKNRNTFMEVYPSFIKRETTEGSYLEMDVEIIPNASYETNYSCLDACVWGVSIGCLPGASKTTANIKITTVAQIRDSKGQILKELKAEGLTSESSALYGFPGLPNMEGKFLKISELFGESYKKSFTLISQYISEEHNELVSKRTPVDTVNLNDKQLAGEKLDEKMENKNVESEELTELVEGTENLEGRQTAKERLDRKTGKMNGRKGAEKDFNMIPSVLFGVGSASVSFGSGMFVELKNYYSSGEEEMTGGTPYYYSCCIGMGLLGIVYSHFNNPPPPNPAAFIGKSPEYIESYANEYRKTSRGRQTAAFGLSYIITHGVGVMSLFLYSEMSTTPGY